MDITGTSNRQFDVKHKDRLKKRLLLMHLFSYNFLAYTLLSAFPLRERIARHKYSVLDPQTRVFVDKIWLQEKDRQFI
jgi:hypothetical protein